MKKDREKWDHRYARKTSETQAPDPILLENQDLLSSGLALDLAAGRGRNAIFLATHGFSVHAIDISFAALSVLQRRAMDEDLSIQSVVADLDSYPLPSDLYDMVLVVNFYQPRLAPAIKRSLKRGGLLFYSTFNHRHTSVRPEFCSDYLVPPGGLSKLFSDLEILLNDPDAGEHGNIARLIARKVT